MNWDCEYFGTLTPISDVVVELQHRRCSAASPLGIRIDHHIDIDIGGFGWHSAAGIGIGCGSGSEFKDGPRNEIATGTCTPHQWPLHCMLMLLLWRWPALLPLPLPLPLPASCCPRPLTGHAPLQRFATIVSTHTVLVLAALCSCSLTSCCCSFSVPS